MRCANCGKDNPEGAVFCSECGRRLDGMRQCPACGKLIAEGSKFCSFCGMNIAPVQQAAQTPMQQAAQTPMQQAAQPVVRQAQPPVQNMGGGVQQAAMPAQQGMWGAPYAGAPYGVPVRQKMTPGRVRQILKLVADGLAAAAALMALIFVFLIGGAVSGYSNAGYTIDDIQELYLPLSGGEWNIFSCFGDLYSDMQKFAELYGKSSFAMYAYNTNSALLIVLAALTLAGTVGCFAFTAIRYARVLLKKSEKGVFAPAMATFIVFVAGVTVLNAFIVQSFNCTISYATTPITIQFASDANGATVAGIVLGGIAIASSFVTELVRGGRKSVNIAGLVTGLAAAVLAFVLLALLTSGVSGGYSDYDNSEQYMELKMAVGPGAIFGFLLTYALRAYEAGTNVGEDWQKFVELYNSELVYIIIFVAAAVVIGAMLALSLPALISGKPKGRSACSVCLMIGGIFGIVAGVMNILIGNEAVSLIELSMGMTGSDTGVYADHGTAIGIIVVSVFVVIAAIACILAGTSARRNAAYAAPYGNYGAPGYAAQPYVQPYAGVAAQPGEVQQQYAQPYAGVAGQPAAAQSGGEAVPADRGAEKTEK